MWLSFVCCISLRFWSVVVAAVCSGPRCALTQVSGRLSGYEMTAKPKYLSSVDECVGYLILTFCQPQKAILGFGAKDKCEYLVFLWYCVDAAAVNACEYCLWYCLDTVCGIV